MPRKQCLTIQNIAMAAAVMALLSLVFLTYANRVDDFDLWWHLKSGELIVRTGSLPSSDIFSYTTVTPKSLLRVGLADNPLKRQPSSSKYWHANLTNSWLGQVFFYLSYRLGGLKGIGILKSLVFVITYLILYLAMLRRGAYPVVSLLVLALIAYIGKDFNYSRPQFFSFLMFALLFYIMADCKRGGKLFYLLPLILLIWANIHGAYVLGVIVILLFAGSETTLHVLGKISGWKIVCSQPRRIRLLLIIAVLSAIASMVNPNTFFPFLEVLAVKKSIFAGIEEYARPQLYEYHAYWFLLLLVWICLLLRLRHFDLTDFLLLLFLTIASQMGIRAIIFFALGAGVLAAQYLSDIFTWLGERKFLTRLRQWSRIPVIVPSTLFQIAVAAILVTLLVQTIADGNVMKFEIKEQTYPAKAVRFLQQHALKGRMFNPYNWGGYLIWNLPKYKVFIDGRCLSEIAYLHYSEIIAAVPGKGKHGNQPLWQYLLDAYGVNFILTNAVDNNGNIVPLAYKMMTDPGWQVIHQDGRALIFLRDSPRNRRQYGRLYLAKHKAVLDEIMSECLTGIQQAPATWGFYANLGAIYLRRYELPKARQMFEKYLSMNPNNRLVIRNLNLIRGLSGEKPLPLPDAPRSPHHF